MMAKELNPLLRPENRTQFMKEAMRQIDILQEQVIQEANRMIPDIKQFEELHQKSFEEYKRMYRDLAVNSSTKKMIDDVAKISQAAEGYSAVTKQMQEEIEKIRDMHQALALDGATQAMIREAARVSRDIEGYASAAGGAQDAVREISKKYNKSSKKSDEGKY